MADVGLEALSRFTKPALLTQATQSPPSFFAAVLGKVAQTFLRRSDITPGAGHNQHMTYPEEARPQTSFLAA